MNRDSYTESFSVHDKKYKITYDYLGEVAFGKEYGQFVLELENESGVYSREDIDKFVWDVQRLSDDYTDDFLTVIQSICEQCRITVKLQRMDDERIRVQQELAVLQNKMLETGKRINLVSEVW